MKDRHAIRDEKKRRNEKGFFPRLGVCLASWLWLLYLPPTKRMKGKSRLDVPRNLRLM